MTEEPTGTVIIHRLTTYAFSKIFSFFPDLLPILLLIPAKYDYLTLVFLTVR